MAYAYKREDQLQTYDPNEDYKKKMDEAVAAGDYESAARYEQQRNEKIKGEGLSQYQTTNQYAQYLPKGQNGTGTYQPSAAVQQAQQMLQGAMAQKPGAYQSTWEGQMQEMLNQILNRKPFEYDLNADALYQQYRDQYMQQGALAMEDTMGRAAALTGGYGNSYAQTVGQQAYQGYLDRLNDKVPELYQLALDRYQAEGQGLMDRYSLLGAQDGLEYDRYRDSLSDYYANIDRLRDQYTDERNWQYQLGRDEIEDQRYLQEWQKAEQEAEKNRAYELALSMLQSGMMPSEAVLSASGLSAEDAQKIYDQANTPVYSGGGGGGGGNGNTDDVENEERDPLKDSLWEELDAAYQKAVKSGNYDDFYRLKNRLHAQGYDVSAFDDYAAWQYSGYDDDGVEDAPLPPTTEDVLALGFGPISEERLDQLIRQGIVVEYEQDGRIRLRLAGKGSGTGSTGPTGSFGLTP